jgi:crossover junction endodeoxyribonuclease RuvC
MTEKTILALDLAARTGWAFGAALDCSPLSGSVRFAKPGASLGMVFSTCRTWVRDVALLHQPDVIVFESPMTPEHMAGRTNAATIRLLVGLAAIVEEACFGRDVREAKVIDIRRHFIGSNPRRAEAKTRTIAACRRLGFSPVDDNAADALALWHYQATVFEPLLSLQTHPLFRRQQ